MIHKNNIFKKAALCVAVCSSLPHGAVTNSNVDGFIKVKITQQQGDAPIAGATVTITNETNGFTTLIVDSRGQFNRSIPVGVTISALKKWLSNIQNLKT